jgi:hypothetical protein
MTYSTQLALALSTLGSGIADLRQQTRDRIDRFRARAEQSLLAFLTQPVTPMALLDLENRLATELRELGRELVACVCNRLEGDDPDALPAHVRFEGTEYRLVRTKTRQSVDTRFGPITLWRHLYRPAERDSPEHAIAPLARTLGIVANTTPALAEAAGRYLAEAGATQRVVQDRLHALHGVTIGTGRLRLLAAHLSEAMSAACPEFQMRRLVDLLSQADRSRGNRKPVVSVGRDGITLRGSPHGLFEVASCATVSVFDRAGRRLGGVCLGFVPEHGQRRMSDQLTQLLGAVLEAWTGPVPRLAYVTDAGENETQYYQRVLRTMTHPRTGERLEWHRVIDFYHAMERVWAMAGALFGEGTPGARSWARKMGRLLKQSNGPFRVLHSAAALRSGRVLSPIRQKEYDTAYRYIRARTAWMQYHEYKNQHVPLGSGVTEAACKTVFTKRLKLSGMRWTKAGAQLILDLRVVLLSGIWERVYRHRLKTYTQNQLLTPDTQREITKEMAT